MAFSAGALFGFNGGVAQGILQSGPSSPRLTPGGRPGALVGLMLIVLATRPAALRTDRRELVRLLLFGVFGVALVQLFYFLAIKRLDIGVSLVIQYLGPVFVALYVRFVLREKVRRRLW